MLDPSPIPIASHEPREPLMATAPHNIKVSCPIGPGVSTLCIHCQQQQEGRTTGKKKTITILQLRTLCLSMPRCCRKVKLQSNVKVREEIRPSPIPWLPLAPSCPGVKKYAVTTKTSSQ